MHDLPSKASRRYSWWLAIAATACASDPPGLPTTSGSTGAADTSGTDASDDDGSGTSGDDGTESSTDDSTSAAETGSGDETQGIDSEPPEVESLAPEANADVLDGRTPLVVRFDEPLATDPAPTLTLTNGDQTISGTFSHELDTLRFVPDDPLPPGTYLAIVDDVADELGNASDEPTQWSFAVVDDAWDASPAEVRTAAAHDQLAIVSDAGGNFTAAWIEGGQVWSSTYLAGTGWGAAARIDSGNTPSTDLELARMGSRVLAGWRQSTVRVATREADGTWSSPINLAAASSFDLEANEAGQAVVAINNISPIRVDAYYANEGSWSPVAEQVAVTDGVNEPGLGDAAIDPAGHAVIVFRRLYFPCGDQSCEPTAEYWWADRDNETGTWTTEGDWLGTAYVAGWGPSITADRDGYFTYTVPDGSSPLAMTDRIERRNAAGETQPVAGADYSGNPASMPTFVASGHFTILVYSSAKGFGSGANPGVFARVFRPTSGNWSGEVQLLEQTSSNYAGAAGQELAVALVVDDGTALVRYCDLDGCLGGPATPVPFGQGQIVRSVAASNDDGLGVVLSRRTADVGESLQAVLFRGRAGL